jgi:membrane protease YdiL (CAAX protease family)
VSGPGGVATGLTAGLVLFVLLAGAPRLPADLRGTALQVASLTAGAGVEELAWRGVGLAALARPLGTAGALGVTSAAFACAHAGILGRRCAVHLLTGAGFGTAFFIGGLPAAVAGHAGYNVLVDLGVRADLEDRAR